MLKIKRNIWKITQEDIDNNSDLFMMNLLLDFTNETSNFEGPFVTPEII